METQKALETINRTSTAPVGHPRTTRRCLRKVLTSMPAGRMVPIHCEPLLREDALGASRVRLDFEMMETSELLVNPVHARVLAYLVPNLAQAKYRGMDDLNRAYEKVAEAEDYIEAAAAPAYGENELWKFLGQHARENQQINMAYDEAYNIIWNYRAKNRSPDITLRTRLQNDLAPAFWQHSRFAHIVPLFDQAAMDGNITLNVPAGSLPVRGIGVNPAVAPVTTDTVFNDSVSGAAGRTYSNWVPGSSANWLVAETNQVASDAVPQIFAELSAMGVDFSLANLEMARKTQAFAELRKRYTGHPDEFIINLLMSGLSIPEQAWKQPILLADETVGFGMTKRYSTEANSLNKSAVTGLTGVDLTLYVPQCPTGGVIMIVAEILPEQIFERQQDPYFVTADVDQLPNALSDILDPEKVDVVQAQYLDNDHDAPTTLAGYAPMNSRWTQASVRCGGRYYRPQVDGVTDTDRQRVWANEVANPVLNEDFYVCTEIHHKPFLIQDEDYNAFDVVLSAEFVISGLTVFGPMLVEMGAVSNFDAVLEHVDQTRIDTTP